MTETEEAMEYYRGDTFNTDPLPDDMRGKVASIGTLHDYSMVSRDELSRIRSEAQYHRKSTGVCTFYKDNDD